MPNNSFSKEALFCIHLPESIGESTRIKLTNSLNNQIDYDWRLQDEKKCRQTICLHFLGLVSLQRDAFKTILSEFESSDYAALYFDSFSKGTGLGTKYKQNFRPVWSPERFLQFNFLGNLIAVDARNNSYPAALSIWDIIWNSKFGLAKNPIAIEIEKNLAADKSHANWVTTWLDQNREKVDITLEKISEVSYKNYAPDRVSVVIPTRGQIKPGEEHPLVITAIESTIAQNLIDTKLEVIVVYDDDVELDYLNLIKQLVPNTVELKLISFTPPFNFSQKCNVGANHATGEVLLFLNDDVQWRSKSGLLELSGIAMLDSVGAVGAKLFFEDEKIQHAGIVAIQGNVGHAYFKETNSNKPYGDLAVTHEVSGVTGACLAQRKNIWQELNGWDEEYENSYNDVDYCFRIRESGRSILIANQVELYHFESVTRDASFSEKTKMQLATRWKDYLINDQYFRQYVHDQLAKPSNSKFLQKLKRRIRRFL
jgi:GT2 family glycosyltransferase